MKTIREELSFFERMIKGLAAQFGEKCEIVLHDLSNDYNHTIIAIENGHVTGRSVGDCGTNLGLEVLRGTAEQGDQYCYYLQTKDGKTLRSSSIYIYDDDGKPIGSICINWDLSDIIYSSAVLEKIISHQPNQKVSEIITNNVRDLLEELIQESIRFVNKPVINMEKEDKVKGLNYLDKKGAFLIKYASARIADVYGISKNTLYNYLEKPINE